MSTGLFFVRRDSTWMTRRISSSRPMTGSSLPSRASSVRSRPYFSSDWYVLLGVLRRHPRGARGPRAARRAVARASTPSSSASASSTWSTDRYSSPRSARMASARSRPSRGLARQLGAEPPTARGSAAERSVIVRAAPRGVDRPPGRAAARRAPPGWASDRQQQVRGRHLGVAGGRRLLERGAERLLVLWSTASGRASSRSPRVVGPHATRTAACRSGTRSRR